MTLLRWRRSLPWAGLFSLMLAGCAMTTGIIPYGPDTFLVSEMRAPVLGGAAEAQRVALAEANAFCAQQGRVFDPVMMGPGGYPYSAYGPTNFSASFRCLARGEETTGGAVPASPHTAASSQEKWQPAPTAY